MDTAIFLAVAIGVFAAGYLSALIVSDMMWSARRAHKKGENFNAVVVDLRERMQNLGHEFEKASREIRAAVRWRDAASEFHVWSQRPLKAVTPAYKSAREELLRRERETGERIRQAHEQGRRDGRREKTQAFTQGAPLTSGWYWIVHGAERKPKPCLFDVEVGMTLWGWYKHEADGRMTRVFRPGHAIFNKALFAPMIGPPSLFQGAPAPKSGYVERCSICGGIDLFDFHRRDCPKLGLKGEK